MTRKKKAVGLLLFLLGSCGAYLYMCYGPGWGIKLEADPWTYFLESIRHGAVMKTLIALLIGGLCGSIPLWGGSSKVST